MRRTSSSRLAQLYGRLERLHATELQVASQRVVEVERRIADQTEVRSAALRAGRVALDFEPEPESDSHSHSHSEARMEWLFAEHEANLAVYRSERLEKLLQERNADRSLAAELHRVSRIDKEQVQRLLEGEAVEAAALEARQEQASADDRFLARRRWLELQVRSRNSDATGV